MIKTIIKYFIKRAKNRKLAKATKRGEEILEYLNRVDPNRTSMELALWEASLSKEEQYNINCIDLRQLGRLRSLEQ